MTESFPYRGNPDKMLLGAIFFGVCAAFMGYEVATNTRGMVINGFIELDPTGATVFYAVIGLFSLWFVVLAVARAVHGHLRKPVLILADDHLVVPSGFFRRLRRVEFARIVSADLQTVARQRFLVLRTSDGKATIARSLLPSDEVFDRIVAAVAERASSTH